jgi:hypothetical protein
VIDSVQTAQDHTGYRRAELSIWDWFPLGDSLAATLGEGMSTGEPLAVAGRTRRVLRTGGWGGARCSLLGLAWWNWQLSTWVRAGKSTRTAAGRATRPTAQVELEYHGSSTGSCAGSAQAYLVKR